MEQHFEIPNVRFVHIISPEMGGQGRGMTIAYVRQEDYLAFAWADKRPGEPYVKAIGRQMTVERLKNWLTHPDFGTIAASDTSEAFSSEHELVGVIHVDNLKGELDKMNIFSKNVIDQINWFDVKHAAISRLLTNILCG